MSFEQTKRTSAAQGAEKANARLNPWLSGALVLGVLLALGALLWHFWPQILVQSLHWQKASLDYLSEQFYLPGLHAKAMILAVCLLYGVLHALGPGHGKVVVSTYLATHATKLRTGIYITIAAALLQGLVAVLLVSVFLFVLHQTMHQLNATVSDFIELSGVFVVALGVYLLLAALTSLLGSRSPRVHQVSHYHDHHHHDDHHHNDHHHDCGCGHKHGADAEELNRANGWREYAAIIISIGLRPCSGAILVLFFAHLANLYWVGVAGSFVMSLGTALTTSVIAFLTVTGRSVVQFYSRIDPGKSRVVMTMLKSIAGLLLLAMGLLLIEMPGYGVSPLFS